MERCGGAESIKCVIQSKIRPWRKGRNLRLFKLSAAVVPRENAADLLNNLEPVQMQGPGTVGRTIREGLGLCSSPSHQIDLHITGKCLKSLSCTYSINDHQSFTGRVQVYVWSHTRTQQRRQNVAFSDFTFKLLLKSLALWFCEVFLFIYFFTAVNKHVSCWKETYFQARATQDQLRYGKTRCTKMTRIIRKEWANSSDCREWASYCI